MGNQTQKMKVYQLVIVLLAIKAIQTGKPLAASYCMGNNNDATTCSACFNWGTGTIGARKLATNACATTVTAITDCKYYNGKITSTRTVYDCMMCNSKKWLNITDHNTPASIAITCVDTAIDTTNCASEVANCDQSICLKPKTGTTSTYCAQCKSGYKGSGTKANGYYPTCASATITNAELGLGSDNTKVYTCKSGYAVVTLETSCKAFTTDSNCRKLGSTDAFCGECWHSYYFDTTTCKLGATLMSFAGIVMAALYLM